MNCWSTNKPINLEHSPWPESGCAFGDEIRWWKFSAKHLWQKFSEIFDCWACMMLVSVHWSLGKDALPIERICDYKALVLSVVVVSHILHCVLASQKHLGRIVAARKFEVFRVVDVLCGVCRNCIQTALVAADRLDLFSKCGQKVSKSWNRKVTPCTGSYPSAAVLWGSGYLWSCRLQEVRRSHLD